MLTHFLGSISIKNEVGSNCRTSLIVLSSTDDLGVGGKKITFWDKIYFWPNQKLQIRVLLIPKYNFQVNLMGGMNFSGWLKAPKTYWRIAFIIWIIQFVYLAFGRTASTMIVVKNVPTKWIKNFSNWSFHQPLISEQ